MPLPLIITNFTVVLFLFAFLLLDNNIFVFAFVFFFTFSITFTIIDVIAPLLSLRLIFSEFYVPSIQPHHRQSETAVCSMDANLFEMENANSIEWHLPLSIQRGEKRRKTKERTRKIDNVVLKCNGICHARHRTEKAERLAVLIESKCSIKKRVNDMDIGCGCWQLTQKHKVSTTKVEIWPKTNRAEPLQTHKNPSSLHFDHLSSTNKLINNKFKSCLVLTMIWQKESGESNKKRRKY